MLIYFIPLLVLAIPMLLSGLFILPIQTFIIMFSPVLALPLFHILACILAKKLKDQKELVMFWACMTIVMVVILIQIGWLLKTLYSVFTGN